MKNYFIIQSLVLCVLTFTGCSEGDDAINPSSQQEELTGIFLDSPVEGLYYESETFSGYTDADGKFSYVEGEEVTFYVGNIEIGSAIGQEEITPLSIASTSSATVETQEVKNIAAFLQTLDRDGDPSNGIKIEQEVVDALSFDTVNFEEPITQLIGEIVNDVNQETGINLNPVYPEEAAVHLAASLNTSYEPSDLLFTDFIPTIESWDGFAKPYLPKTASIWIHKIDEDGKPTQSIQYEKYPYRISKTYTYSSFNELDLPERMEIQYHSFGEETGNSINNLTYNSEGQINSWIAENSPLWRQEIELNENGLIIAVSYFFNNSFQNRKVNTYNDDGNIVNEVQYSEMFQNSESIEFNYNYTYTGFGEIETLDMQYPNSEISYFTWKYSYDENNILIKRHRETVDRLGRDRTDTYFYDEEERVERLLIEVGDFVSDYVEFYNNGDPKRAETTYQGFLYEIVTWDEDGNSEWKIIEEDTGYYRIEYKDPDENILKTEFYDNEGNLLSVEE